MREQERLRIAGIGILLLLVLSLCWSCKKDPTDKLVITPNWNKNAVRTYSILKISKTLQENRQSYSISLGVTEKTLNDYELTVRYMLDKDTEISALYSDIMKTMNIRYQTNPGATLLRLLNQDEINASYNQLIKGILAQGGFETTDQDYIDKMGMSPDNFKAMFLEEIEILHCFYNIPLLKGGWLNAPNPFVITGAYFDSPAGVNLNSIDTKKKLANITLVMNIVFPKLPAADTKLVNDAPITGITWKIQGNVNYNTGWVEDIFAEKTTTRDQVFTQVDQFYIKRRK